MEVVGRPRPSIKGDAIDRSSSPRAQRVEHPLADRRRLLATSRVHAAQQQYQPLVFVAIATALGLVIDRYLCSALPAEYLARLTDCSVPPRFAVWSVLAIALLFLWWLTWHYRHDFVAPWVLLAAVAFAGAAWHHLRWDLFNLDEIGRYATPHSAGPSCVEVTALESPERLSAPRATPLRAIPVVEHSRLLVAPTAIRDGTRWRRATGKCQLTVDGHLLGVRCGDRLRVFGQLIGPHPPLNPGEFDFTAHARADRQLAQLRCSSPDCVAIRSHGSRWTASSRLDTLRLNCKRLVHEFVGSQQADLAAAILLGAREGLTTDTIEPYLVTGTIHVLVVSGMNVAILAAGLLPLLHFGCLPRRAGLAFIMIAVVVYALLTKCQPPAVRAAVLGVLMCMAAWTGRRGVALNSLAASGLCVLAINPADLFRIGPQLSFAAVATLVFVGRIRTGVSFLDRSSDPLQHLLAAAQPWYSRMVRAVVRGLVWLLLTSGAVWLVTLPLVLSNFHVASPISVLISPLVWPLAFAAMWAGFILLALGWLAPPIGLLCGSICSASLGGLDCVVTWAEQLPGGHQWMPGPALWWVVGFYAGSTAVLIGSRRLPPLRWQFATMCLWILVGLVPAPLRAVGRDSLTCSFIAVGHGTCVVLEAPGGETLLYDAGAMGSPEATTQTIASYLWHRGITTLDGIVISHADVDHYSAVPGLLDRFHVSAVYVSPVMSQDLSESSDREGRGLLRMAMQRHSVPIVEIQAGDAMRVGPHLRIDVLHPPEKGVLGSDNANSLTLAVEYDNRRLLLPGDLESPGINDVMAELPYDCDVVLAPHHGSGNSDPPGFAAWCTPEWVVISGSSAADTSSVVRAYQTVGAAVLQTQTRGAIKIAMQPRNIRVTTFCHLQPR